MKELELADEGELLLAQRRALAFFWTIKLKIQIAFAFKFLVKIAVQIPFQILLC
jgi:hypothetical protein